MVLAATALVVGAPVAQAATVAVYRGYEGPVVSYKAAAGEANRLTVRIGPGSQATIVETGATVTVGAGCTRLDPQTVACAGFSEAVYFELEDGDDVLELTDAPSERMPVFASGGPGADALRGCASCRAGARS